jgi:tRNA/rRNA methyltransferase
VAPRTRPERRADVPSVQGLLAHWAAALARLEFFDPAVPRKLLPRLNRLINRAEPTEEEVHILRGIARAIEVRVAPKPISPPAQGGQS